MRGGKTRQALTLVIVAAVLFSASSLLIWQWVEGKGVRLRNPAPVDTPGPFIHNGVVGIWPGRVYHGIIDLFYFDPSFFSEETGNWRQFNNVVPVASTRWFVNNSEMEHARIQVEFLEEPGDSVRAKLHFGRFRNGIEIGLLVTLDDASIIMEVQPTANSARIHWLTLGTYAGFLEWPTEVHYGGGVLRVDDLQASTGGYLKPGEWVTIPSTGLDNVVRLRSEGPVVQTIQVLPGLGGRDRLEVELRTSPWLPVLPSSDRPWFEAVQLIREPFALDRNVWVFSVVTAVDPV